MLRNLSAVKKSIEDRHPLIHCITSPIAINDCANAVLAIGAQPIMAEHPSEVAAITKTAGALTVSLANITDARLRSIHIAGAAAREAGIPALIDLVGITCSPLRMEHALSFIADARPAVIKGNYSEIRAITGDSVSAASGVDTAEEDKIHSTEDKKLSDMKALVHRYAAERGCVVMATGVIDILSDGETDWCITNGHPLMSRITGTGCILTCIAGTYLSSATPLDACLYALVHWGVSGERAADFTQSHHLGLGFYHTALMDFLSLLSPDELMQKANIQ